MEKLLIDKKEKKNSKIHKNERYFIFDSGAKKRTHIFWTCQSNIFHKVEKYKEQRHTQKIHVFEGIV